MSSFPCLHKKIAGNLTVTKDALTWTSAGSQKPSVHFQLTDVLKLQATPESSAKCILKVVAKHNDQEVNYLFNFVERSGMDDAKLALQGAVSLTSDRSSSTPQPGASGESNTGVNGSANGSSSNNNGTSNEHNDSNETNGGDPSRPTLLDAKSLLSNFQLQRQLLDANKELKKMFQETVVQGGLANEEFWETRIHLLRTFALESAQKRGPYNVLATIRPTTTSDNKLNVSLTREKIHDIFEQYPLVRHAYNETVPKLSESEFWGRFFTSRLFRKLRGEKASSTDNPDPVLDRYLTQVDTDQVERPDVNSTAITSNGVPFYLDVEGNEENDPQRLGNRPDLTMVAGNSSEDTMSLIRTMNRLSQRMILAPNVDDDSEKALVEELRLNSLEVPTATEYAALTLKNQDYSAPEKESVKETVDYSKLNDMFSQPIDLEDVCNTEDSVIEAISNHITNVIKQTGEELDEQYSLAQSTQDKKLTDHVQMCYATTIEFLRHFWSHFLSGDANQAVPLSKIYNSLLKSVDRVFAVIENSEPGDKDQVSNALQPLLKSIDRAKEVYSKALMASE